MNLSPYKSHIRANKSKAHRRSKKAKSRRYGVPGFSAGQPGWAGQAGIAQSPHMSRPIGQPPGLQMGVQTYGSLGYASMGNGSMDMSVRGQVMRRGKRRG